MEGAIICHGYFLTLLIPEKSGTKSFTAKSSFDFLYVFVVVSDRAYGHNYTWILLICFEEFSSQLD